MLIRFGDSANLSQFGILCNTGDAGLFSNVDAAIKLGLPEVEYYKSVAQPAVVCGGGPSLADTLESIRALKDAGARIFALNNTAKFLAENGIRADVQIILDPRAQNADFIEAAWTDELLLASQCHPALFAQAAKIGYQVRVFHMGMEGVQERLTHGKQCVIGGGFTVGLSALCLIYTLGHRTIHLFGYDSSHAAGRGHAYKQEIDCEMVNVAVDSNAFECSLAMATQAHEFKGVAEMLKDNGCALHVYGQGLLPTLWRVWERERTQRILTVCYDLGLCNPGFEFAAFISAAERYRRANNFDRMDIVFQPGPMHGFRFEEQMPNIEGLREMLWRICVGMARKQPSVRNIEILGERRSAGADVFPEGYAEDAPRAYTLEDVQPLEKTS